MRSNVAFIADSLDNAYRFQKVLARMDVEVSAGSTLQIPKMLQGESAYDLIIFESRGNARAHMAEVSSYADDRGCPLLVIVDADEAEDVPLASNAPRDFIVHGAGEGECLARVRHLLQMQDVQGASDVIAIDGMSINLATYQVTIAGQPIDLTYLEYALLAFLVKHPGRTFSRDALLQHVWGFDYYGGSRTVDVHVRRIRAKIGPELAQHLETVRGVGYLWNA